MPPVPTARSSAESAVQLPVADRSAADRSAESSANAPAICCKFAIVSDLHVALPGTVWDHPSRFHLVEVAIPAFEQILDRLAGLDLDFLLLPGDLTQHGEPENHAWLADRLAALPYPTYVIPGNHDVPATSFQGRPTTLPEFVEIYRNFGYQDSGDRPYYSRPLCPGWRIVGLNSNQISEDGREIVGYVDEPQLDWLRAVLAENAATARDRLLVTVHHNLVEHLPGQATHPLGRRYMLRNAAELRSILQAGGANLAFTGHLHVQDVAETDGFYDVTTGSLVSYPHPFRVVTLREAAAGRLWVEIESGRVNSVPGWDCLPETSREWMGDRSAPFMRRLLNHAGLGLSPEAIDDLVPDLRYFWADIAAGDAQFAFDRFPPEARRYCEGFGAVRLDGTYAAIDNHAAFCLDSAGPVATPARRDRPWRHCA